MAQINDNDPPSGGDWFDQPGPPPSSGGAATTDQVSALYQQLLGRAPENDQVVQSWIQGTGGNLDAIKQGIAATDEGKAYASKTPAAVSGGGRTDRNAILAQVAQWASMPGADPSLAKDPNYWADRILEKGGLGDDNRQYWQDASVGPTAFFNNPNRDQNPSAAASQFGPGSVGFGGVPSPYVSDANAPSPYQPATWTGGPPPTAPTLSRYSLPTQAELEASPGYLSRMKADQVAQERSAAAQGSVLNGGFQVALARRQGELASNEYSNLVGQGLAVTGANNNASQAEFGDTFANYQARYGQFTDANAFGQQGYQNTRSAYDANNARTQGDYILNTTTQRNAGNDYWSHLNDLYTAGLSAANNSYKPSPQL